MKTVVHVSDEMVTLVGLGPTPAVEIAADVIVFHFSGLADGREPLLSYRGYDAGDCEASPLVFVVSRAACERLFGDCAHAPQTWHLPSHLRSLALSIIECEAKGEACTTLRLARSIELLCQIHASMADGVLLPSTGDGALSEHDVARIASVRRVVDQRWHEKLTIAELARAGGVNRDKLVRGFRDLYGATIAETLAERRRRKRAVCCSRPICPWRRSPIAARISIMLRSPAPSVAALAWRRASYAAPGSPHEPDRCSAAQGNARRRRDRGGARAHSGQRPQGW